MRKIILTFKYLFVPKYLIRINYKSGHSEEIWVLSFEIDNFNIESKRSMKWKTFSDEYYPMFVGITDIESIFQIKARFW